LASPARRRDGPVDPGHGVSRNLTRVDISTEESFPLNVTGRTFTKPAEPGEPPPRHIEYTDDVVAFFHIVGSPASCWNDYNYVSNNGRDKIFDDTSITNATLDDIRAMLTYYIRSERFGDGSWLHLLESGRITAVLKRLAELRETVAT
jgi:hypothetical protein